MSSINPDFATHPFTKEIQQPSVSKPEKNSITSIKDQTLAAEPAAIQSEKEALATHQRTTQTEWHSLQLTNNQLDEFRTIIEDTIKPLINDHNMAPEDQLFSIENIDMEIGNMLHPTEIAVLRFYTMDGFRIMNGSFDHDQSIKDFMTTRNIPETEFENVKRAGKMFSLIAASGLNKLPAATQSNVYRGDAISEERWKQTVPGTKIIMNRFTSTSQGEGTAKTFSMTNALKNGGIGVVYVIMDSTRAKNIELLSGISHGKESERVYPPHQHFEVVKSEIEEEPDLTDITGFDEEIEKARKNGNLVEMTNAKGKQKFYEQTGIQTTNKIYLKEVE